MHTECDLKEDQVGSRARNDSRCRTHVCQTSCPVNASYLQLQAFDLFTLPVVITACRVTPIDVYISTVSRVLVFDI